jgi:hypothetical protein
MSTQLPSTEALVLLCCLQQSSVVLDTVLQALPVWLTSASQRPDKTRREYAKSLHSPYFNLCVGMGIVGLSGVIDLGALLAPGVPRVLALMLMVFLTVTPLMPFWQVRGLVHDYVILQGTAFTLAACAWPDLVELPYRVWVLLGSAGSYLVLFAGIAVMRKRPTGQSVHRHDGSGRWRR